MNTKKLMLLIMIIFSSVLSSFAVAFGNEITHSHLELPVSLYSGAGSAVLGSGDSADIDFELIYKDGVIFAPTRLFEFIFGATVTQTTIYYDDIKAEFSDGENNVKIGSYTCSLKDKPFEKHGVLYIPLEEVCGIFSLPVYTEGELVIFDTASNLESVKSYEKNNINLHTEEIAELLCAEKNDFSSEDYNTISKKWKQYLCGDSNLNDVTDDLIADIISEVNKNAKLSIDTLLSEPTSTCLFSDINVTETTHMSETSARIYNMARAWGTYGSDYYMDASVLDKIITSLDWFVDNLYGEDEYNGTGWKKTMSFNWYDWQLGVPKNVLNTLLIIKDEVTLAKISEYTYLIDKLCSKTSYTGANFMELCYIIALDGVINQNSDKLRYASEQICESLVYVDCGRNFEWQLDSERSKYVTKRGSGFYTDGSYVFHTLHPYNGGYAITHFGTAARLMGFLADTSFEIPKTKADIMSEFYFEAFDALFYKGNIFRMSTGSTFRPFVSSYQPEIIAGMLNSIDLLDDEKKKEVENSIYSNVTLNSENCDYYTKLSITEYHKLKNIMTKTDVIPVQSTGSKVFHNMDQICHRTDSWAMGIQMSSSRIFNYESINNANKTAWYIADGRTDLYIDDDYAKKSFLYWTYVDPYKLPGTTVDTQARKAVSIKQGNEYLSSKDFVGGVSLGGEYSVGAMHLESYHNEKDFGTDGGSYGGKAPAHQNDLTAKKSYFLFDNSVYCLGSEIKASNNNNANVLTIVENRFSHYGGSSGIKITANGNSKESSRFDFGLFAIGSDWSEVAKIRIPVYSMVNNGEKMNVVMCKDSSDASLGYYFCKVTVNWQGWNVVEIPVENFIAGRGITGWDEINSIYFNFGGWNNPPTQASTELYFADLEALDSDGNVIHTVPFSDYIVAKAGGFTHSTDIIYDDISCGRVDSNTGGILIPVEEEVEFEDTDWFNLNGNIGYVFPESDVAGELKASMSREGYFQCYIDHGVNPADGSYAYAILPNMTKSQTESYAQNPDTEILCNTGSVQAVRNNRLGITGIVFWEAGSFGGITVSEPMILMYRDFGGEVSVAVSDPTHKLQSAVVTFDTPFAPEESDDRIFAEIKDGKTVLNIRFENSDGKSLELNGKSRKAVVTSYNLTDTQANAINKFKAEKSEAITLSAHITNAKDDFYAYIIIASYKSDKLISCDITECEVRYGSDIVAEIEDFKPLEADFVKYFVWDKNNLMPLEELKKR